MRLNDGLGNAEQRRAADLARIKERLERVHILFEHGSRELIGGVFIENAFETLHKHHGCALNALEQHVSGETVTHKDIHVSGENVARFHVADKVKPPSLVSFLQKSIGLLLKLRSLRLLRADVQKTDAGIFAPEKIVRVELAHIGKLQQILRRAFHIRAAVDQKRTFAAVRDHRAKAGTADAADAAHRERSAAQKSAGASGGNDGVTLAAVKQLERNGH